jgi:hypothetical protein
MPLFLGAFITKKGVMDKMVGLFALNFSCGQNGWSFF